VLMDTAFPSQTDAAPEMRERRFHRRRAARRDHGPDTGSVFHLAAVVSGGRRGRFRSRIRVNLDGTRGLLEACRKQARPPRYVFASSVAAFGGDLPPVLDDTTTPNPQTSYGAHKVCGEYLATDFNRKGFIDGRSLRLPTNRGARGKAQSGRLLVCQRNHSRAAERRDFILSRGRRDRRVAALARQSGRCLHSCPRTAVCAWGVKSRGQPAGITASVAQMVEALRKNRRRQGRARVEWKPDARIQASSRPGPARFTTERALHLGFVADKDVETVIRDYIRDQGIVI